MKPQLPLLALTNKAATATATATTNEAATYLQ